MPDHVGRPRPGALAPGTGPDAATVGRELDRLAIAYPAFRFSLENVGRHGCCWEARRKHGLRPGLHTVITAELSELRARLASAEGADHGR
jgi:hypothetical protein